MLTRGSRRAEPVVLRTEAEPGPTGDAEAMAARDLSIDSRAALLYESSTESRAALLHAQRERAEKEERRIAELHAARAEAADAVTRVHADKQLEIENKRFVKAQQS